MSHKARHTTVVRGTFYYNRRVPRHAVDGFGRKAVRCMIGKDEGVALAVSSALSAELETIWNTDHVKPIDLERLVERRIMI